VGRATFTFGAFLTDVLSFLIAALVAYFVLVRPVTRLLQLLERNRTAACRDCPQCTMSIPVASRRCPECTAEITAATEQPQPVR
jgi:large conductance mechanosensitive channel